MKDATQISTPEAQALVLDQKNGDLHVMPAAIADPGVHQIAIRARAVAINPIDRYMSPLGGFITPWLRYPAVLGWDVAGEVVVVGANVTRFRVGQRVLGLALGTEKGRGAAEGAFQTRVLLDEQMASPIPDGLSFADAAVLPLGLCTAASSLFQADFLALRPPIAESERIDQSVLIWGASTSVGCNAVQLAALAGYDVVATASPRNHTYITALGARAVFDYRGPAVIAELKTALKGRHMAGAMAIGEGSLAACIKVLRGSDGRRFVAVATPGLSFESLIAGGTGWHRLLPFLARMGLTIAGDALSARRSGVTTRFVIGSSLKDNAVGPMIFEEFLPSALADRRFVVAPPALVIGHGLEAIPDALSEQAKGVSARKIVVTL